MLSYNFLRRLAVFAGICFLFIVNVYGQDLPKEYYNASGIPDSVKEDANSVVRYSLDEIKIKGPGKAEIKHHSIVTVLNEKGDKEALIGYGYNKKYDTYSFIDIHIYDEAGKMIKKYRKSDMYDGSAGGDETLVSDDRFLALKHTIAKYPETIEIEYEEDINSFITPPGWQIQDSFEQSVQNSQCKVWASPNYGFRFKSKNINLAPEKSTDGQYELCSWKVKNLKALKNEDRSLSSRILPKIEFATSGFDCFGYPGDISSWQTFGKWIKGLNNEICTLSPIRIAEVKKMTDTIKTDKDKARFLYKYMQQNMRYVSIQLGIGGYRPFPATFVDEKKYGDCKALSNYMRALLKAVDIPSYYTLVRAGENGESSDYAFPHNDFNHVILCIPFKNDTTWLECTSNKTQFGKLGSFTENRTALLITEDGGQLVTTPKSLPKDNQLNSEVYIAMQPDGSAKTQIKLSATGEYRLEYVEMTALKLDEQKQFWLEQLQIKQPSSFDLEPGKDTLYTKQVVLNMEFDKFCDVMNGDKQFYRPAAFKLWANTVPILEKRKTDFYWEWPRIKSCVTTIDLPQGFEVETMPVNASLKFTYGSYDISYAYNKDKNQVTSTAKFVLNNQVIPASKYTEMQQYMDAVAKAQNKKLVIKKKA